MAQKTKKKAAAPPVEEVEEVEEDLELEELDEDEVEEAPVKAKKTDDVTFGASHLAALASKKTGKEYDAKTVRTLLRKMARSGELDREISPENRARYSWSGPKDPEVLKILAKIEGGAIEEARNEALGKLKKQKEAERAAKQAATEEGAPKAKKKKAAPPPPDDDDVEDLEDDED